MEVPKYPSYAHADTLHHAAPLARTEASRAATDTAAADHIERAATAPGDEANPSAVALAKPQAASTQAASLAVSALEPPALPTALGCVDMQPSAQSQRSLEPLANARTRAQTLASSLGAGAVLSEPIDNRDGAQFAYFRVTLADGRAYFAKVLQDPAQAEGWHEPKSAAWAAARDLAPETTALDGWPDVLVTEWVHDATITKASLANPKVVQDVMRLLARVHQHDDAPAHLAPPDLLPERLENTWRALEILQQEQMGRPFDLVELQARVQWLQASIDRRNIQQTLCHFDTLPRNLMHDGASASLVDWDWLRWGDPMRDIAKFCTLGRVPVASTPMLLAEYLGRAPSQQELVDLLVVMDGMALDYMVHNLRSTRDPEHSGVVDLARRLVDSQAFLPDAPALRLNVAKRAS